MIREVFRRKRGPINLPELVDAARALKCVGYSYSAIARYLATYPTTVKRWLDPAYAEYRKAQVNRQRKLRESRECP
jgi:hypothetical protein